MPRQVSGSLQIPAPQKSHQLKASTAAGTYVPKDHGETWDCLGSWKAVSLLLAYLSLSDLPDGL